MPWPAPDHGRPVPGAGGGRRSRRVEPAAMAEAMAAAMRAPAPPAGLRYRAGIDVVAVEEVAASLAAFGDRYARRLFTAAERSDSRWPVAGPDAAESLAARFAAKEAVVKVLAPDGWAPSWTEIEVRRRPSGACELALSGGAASRATDVGVISWAVSLTHHGGVAAAVVLALCEARSWHDELGSGSGPQVDRGGGDG